MSTVLTNEPAQETAVTATDPWTMAGTEGTNEYRVLAESSFGRLGYRNLSGFSADSVRIRLEPSDEAHAAKIAEVLTPEAGWKQPGDGDQNRFSIVLPKGQGAIDALKKAFGLIKRGRPIAYNPALPDLATDLA